MLYRVWKTIQVPSRGHARRSRRLLFSVASPTEGRIAIRHLRAKERSDPTAPIGRYGLEIRSRDGWIEWRDRGGERPCGGIDGAVLRT